MTTWRAMAAGASLVLLLAGCGGGQDTTGGDEQTPPPAPTAEQTELTEDPTGAPPQVPVEQTDIDVVGDGKSEHLMDVHLPEVGEGPFPVVMWVHGGGWQGGDKSDVMRGEDIQMVQTTQFLRENGFAVAAGNYHVLPDTQFPEPMQDVAAAVRYLRAHAAELGVDPDRIALMGDSAGAHLAAMVALTADRPDLQGTLGDTSTDARVDAFVGYYGLYDLSQRTQNQIDQCGGARPGAESSHGRLVGVDPDTPEGQDQAKEASPTHHVNADSPPVLLFHGTQDCTAPEAQAQDFKAALDANGVTNELTVIEKAHGDPQFWTDDAIHQQLLTFLQSHVN
ncbi:MAG: alpha/beta hydrolase [Mobilicoccus sp.]|nr:alpha/beta hydrolase [Mobilicoccus sp.]